MAQTVEIPGVGSVEFPDGMSKEEMEKSIQGYLKEEHPLSLPEPTPESVEGADPSLVAPWFNPIEAALGAGVGGAIGKGAMALPALKAALVDMVAGTAAEEVSGDKSDRFLLPMIVNVLGGVFIEKSGGKVLKGLKSLAGLKRLPSTKVAQDLIEEVSATGAKKGTEEFATSLEQKVKENLKGAIREQLDLFKKGEVKTVSKVEESGLELGKPGEFLGSRFEPAIEGGQIDLFPAGEKALGKEALSKKLLQAKWEAEARKAIEEGSKVGKFVSLKEEKPGLEQFISREMTMDKTPETRAMYVYARKSESSTTFETVKWDEKVEGLGFGGLSAKEKSNLFLAREGKLDVNTLTEKELKAFQEANPKIQAMLDGMYSYYGRYALKKSGVEVPAGAGVKEIEELLKKEGLSPSYLDNYLPHIFNGDYWVTVGGKKVSAFTNEFSALKEAKRLLKEQPSKDIRVTTRPSFNTEDVSYLGRKGYERFIGKIKDVLNEGLEETIFTREDVQNSLKGVVQPRPSHKFVGNFLERLVDSPNYEKDIEKALSFYGKSVIRKVNLDDYVDTQEKILSQSKGLSPEMVKYVREVFEPSVMGRPSKLDSAVSNSLEALGLPRSGLKSLASSAQRLQFLWDMGYSGITAIAQLGQQINTLSVVGPKHFKSYHSIAGDMLTTSGREKVKEAFDVAIHDVNLLGKPVEHFKQIFSPSGLFRATELGNRVGAYMSGKSWGGEIYDLLRSGSIKDKNKALGRLSIIVPKTDSLYQEALNLAIGKSSRDRTTFGIEAGLETVQWTQGQYGRISSSPLFDTNFIKALVPYKQFLINQMRFSMRLASPWGILKHPKEALTFLGTTAAIGGMYGNPLLWGYAHSADVAMRYLWPEKETLTEFLDRKGYDAGLVGKLGADISGAVSVNLPTKLTDVTGRLGKGAYDLGSYINARTQGRSGRQEWRNLMYDSIPSQGRRLIEGGGTSGLLPEGVRSGLEKAGIPLSGKGEVRSTKTGELIEEVNDPALRGVKSFLGVRPPQESRMQRRAYELSLQEKASGLRKRDFRDDLSVAIQKGDMNKVDGLLGEVATEIDRQSDLFLHGTTEKRKMEAVSRLTELQDVLKETGLKSPLLKLMVEKKYRTVLKAPKGTRPLAIERMLPIEEGEEGIN